MKYMFINLRRSLVAAGLFFLLYGCNGDDKSLNLTSKDGLNTIELSLNEKGMLYYQVKRKDSIIIGTSPMGLKCDDQDFTQGLSVDQVSPVEERREIYQLKVSNQKEIDHSFTTKSVTFKNSKGALMIVDLISGEEGVAFRYRFSEKQNKIRTVEEEITGFQIEKNAKGWLQPYNSATYVTPGYEDFYFNVSPGDTIANPRNPSVGWCMPALFNVNNKNCWMLIAEAGTDGSYAGCHLRPDSDGGMYRIAFPKKDEKFQLPIDDRSTPNPKSELPWTMPWRVIIVGDHAADILLSSFITDLAPASKIEDVSWIESGKASWSWWSEPDDMSAKIYNRFTDLAVSFGWEYTLFDAGWEKADSAESIIDRALSKGIKPLVWGFSGDYFEPEKRKARLKRFAKMGIKGVKIDFWCSDRQEVMGALQGVFEDAANEHLLVNLHGVTVPRGWHRTWPNFLTAEAILGLESYFYEPRYPDKAAEQNTVLPFTRNVAGPADYTAVALTMRKYPRLNTGVHELATPMIYTSGIIHFADSKEVFESLPADVKTLLKEMPSTWDKSEGIVCEPGEAIVLSRQKDSLSYIVGINGTNKPMPLELNLKKYSGSYTHFKIITEGKDPLMDFTSNTYPIDAAAAWSYAMAPKGGFIIQFLNDPLRK